MITPIQESSKAKMPDHNLGKTARKQNVKRLLGFYGFRTEEGETFPETGKAPEVKKDERVPEGEKNTEGGSNPKMRAKESKESPEEMYERIAAAMAIAAKEKKAPEVIEMAKLPGIKTARRKWELVRKRK